MRKQVAAALACAALLAGAAHANDTALVQPIAPAKVANPALVDLGKKLAKQLHARQNHNDWEGVDASTQELMKRLMESH